MAEVAQETVEDLRAADLRATAATLAHRARTSQDGHVWISPEMAFQLARVCLAAARLEQQHGR